MGYLGARFEAHIRSSSHHLLRMAEPSLVQKSSGLLEVLMHSGGRPADLPRGAVRAGQLYELRNNTQRKLHKGTDVTKYKG